MLNRLSISGISGASAHLPVRTTARIVLPAAVAVAVCAQLLLLSSPAQAGLFSDNEARKAILELREETAANRVRVAETMDQLGNLHRSTLDLHNQIQTLKEELSQERGKREELERTLQQLKELLAKMQEAQQVAQRREAQLQQQLDTQSVSVTADGVRFEATGAEKSAFDAAVALYRQGDYNGAIMQLTDFEQKFPGSSYLPSVRMAQGNAYFVQKEYASAMKHFRAMISQSPNHPAAAEAALSIASSQAALGRAGEAKKTLKDLITVYPDSEAAATAKQRLKKR